MASSSCISRRYYTLALCTEFFVIYIGYRTMFALVMSHVSKVNQTVSEGIFSNCSTIGKDYHVAWTGSKVAFLHTLVYLGLFTTQFIGGVLAVLFPPKNVLAVSIFTTSVLYLLQPSAIMANYELTAFIRFVQGLFEGCMVPGIYGFLAAWTPTGQRSQFVAIVNSGAFFSPAIALVISGGLTCYVQWDAVIYLYGTMGIIWTILAVTFVYHTPQEDPRMGAEEKLMYEKDTTKVKPSGIRMFHAIPWKGILTSLPVYAILTAVFCKNWMFSILVTLQPEYFKDAFGMNTATIGLLTCVPFVFNGITAISAGYLFDNIINRKWLTRINARKLANTIGFGTEGACVVALYFVGRHQWKMAFTLLSVGVGMSGVMTAGFQSNSLEVAPQFTSVIAAFSRIGMISGILSTALVGVLVGDNHNIKDWQNVFLIAGMIHLCGLTFFLMFSSSEVQSWAKTEEMTVLVADKGQK